VEEKSQILGYCLKRTAGWSPVFTQDVEDTGNKAEYPLRELTHPDE